MKKRCLYILLSGFLFMLVLPHAALATAIGDDVTSSLPIESHMETVAEAVYANAQISLTGGSANLIQDHAKGNYALNVVIGDVPNQSSASFDLATSNSFNISEYSQIKLWVKPGARAKNIKFYTANTLITCDANQDGMLEVGKDLTSGKWNEITLDLNKTQTKLTQGSGLKAEVNDSSTWSFDEVCSVNSTTFPIDLSRMVNAQTRLNNGALEFKPKSGDTFDTTPTVISSQKLDSLVRSAGTQDDFTGECQQTQVQNSTISLASTSQGLDDNTKLLLHMDHTNNGIIFTDETGKTMTRNGDACTKMDTKHIGTGSAYFDGNGDYISLADSDDWNFGSGDFTIDFWVNFNSLPMSGNYMEFYSQYPDGNNYNTCFIYNDSGTYLFKFAVVSGGVTQIYIPPTVITPTAGTWIHYALVRTNYTFKVFQNGIQIGSDYYTDKSVANISAPLLIGTLSGYPVRTINGYLDEIRISKGIARWTENFTPPADAYTVDQYTKLLAHMDFDGGTTFADASGKTVTRNGDTVTKSSTPKFGTASGYFDGTGDYLTVADSDDWNMGTSNFTIDFWYKTTGTATCVMLQQGNYGTTTATLYLAYNTSNTFTFGCGAWSFVFNTSAINIRDGNWHHIAIVRKDHVADLNSSFMFFVDGTAQTLYLGYGDASMPFPNGTGAVSIGAGMNSSGSFGYYPVTGYIDEFRISKGIARWTSSFAPPSHEYGVSLAISGVYTHPIQDLTGSGVVSNSTITYKKTTPTNTAISMETRYTTDSGSTWSDWIPRNSGEAFVPEGTSLENCRGQWRATLTTNDTTVTPELSNITMTVDSDYNDAPPLPNGKISKIFIDSGYSSISSPVSDLPASKTYLSDVKPTMISLSGDGRKIYYKNPADSNKIYLLNLETGESAKVSDRVPADIKCNYDGSKVAYRDAGNNLYIGSTLISPAVTLYAVNHTGNIAYYKTDSTLNLYNGISQNIYSGSVTCLDIAKTGDTILYSTTTQLNKLTKTPAGWKTSLLATASANITGLYSNNDGSLVYIKLTDGSFYVYEAYSKALRKLSLSGATVVQVLNDNRIAAQDPNYNYFIYDPETDESTDIRPADAKNPASAADISFGVDQSGSEIAYLSCDPAGSQTGVGVASIDTEVTSNTASSTATTTTTTALPSGAKRPERYLFSFDNKATWHSYKNGIWEQVADKTPVKADFDQYGMTIDEVNALGENDFASLYEGGRQIVAFDVAIHFASVNPYITPSLRGIVVTLSQSSNGFGNELTEKALFAAKQQLFDGSNWRKVRKIYPVEIAVKDTQMYYFINVDNVYKVYKNEAWQEVPATLFDNVETTWIDITLQGMTAQDLRAIPESALTDLLHGKNFSVVYCLKVLDQSTKEYKSLVNIDYVEDLFTSATLTLNIIYSNGDTKQYTGLTDTEVEDFMQWLSERQFNRGAIYYRIKTGNNNDFINYYMVQSVNVTE